MPDRTAMAKKILLSLGGSEDAEPLYIDVFGKNYPLIGKRDIGFRAWSRILRLQRNITEAPKDEDDEPAFDALEASVTEMVRIICPTLPRTAIDRLNAWDRLAICEAFSKAMTPETTPAT